MKSQLSVTSSMMKIARNVSAIILRDFSELKNLQTSSQGTDNFAISSYRKIERTMVNAIKNSFPEDKIILPEFSFTKEEESIENTTSETVSRWIIKPIDGIVNFSHTFPLFASSIAYQEYDKNTYRTKYSIVTLYPEGELFCSQADGGTFIDDNRIKTSGRNKLSDSILITDIFSNAAYHNYAKLFSNIKSKFMSIISSNVAIANLALVAQGRCDCAIVVNTNEMSLISGLLVAKESGCEIGSADGRILIEKDILGANAEKILLVANPQIRRKVVESLNATE